jgi:hypothetical protein
MKWFLSEVLIGADRQIAARTHAAYGHRIGLAFSALRRDADRGHRAPEGIGLVCDLLGHTLLAMASSLYLGKQALCGLALARI